MARSQDLLHGPLKELFGWFEDVDIRYLKISALFKNHGDVVSVFFENRNLPEINGEDAHTDDQEQVVTDEPLHEGLLFDAELSSALGLRLRIEKVFRLLLCQLFISVM